MDNDPQTRKQKQSGKYKQVFNKKTIRLKEALVEKQKVKGKGKAN